MDVAHANGVGTIAGLGSSDNCRAGTCVYEYNAMNKELQITVGGDNCEPDVKDVTCAVSISVNEPLATELASILLDFPKLRLVVCCRQAGSWPESVGG